MLKYNGAVVQVGDELDIRQHGVLFFLDVGFDATLPYSIWFEYDVTYEDAGTEAGHITNVVFNEAPFSAGGRKRYDVAVGEATIIFVSSIPDFDPENDHYTTNVKIASGCEGLEFYQFNPVKIQTFVAEYEEEYWESYTDAPTPADAEEPEDDGYGPYYEIFPIYSDEVNKITWGYSQPGSDSKIDSLVTPRALDDWYGRLFVVSTHSEYDADFECVLEYTYDDGDKESEPQEVTIVLAVPLYIPKCEQVAIETVQWGGGGTQEQANAEADAKVTITLSPSTKDSKTTLLVVSTAMDAAHGTFYQEDGKMLTYEPESSSFVQYPTSAVSSSEWPQEGMDTPCILGPPDLWPEHGDKNGAWQPNSGEHDGLPFTDQSVDLTMDEPVFVRSVTIYETWSPNRVMEVLAFKQGDFDSDKGDWVSIWARINPSQSTPPSSTQAAVEDVILCQTRFMAKSIRLRIEIESEGHWYAIDAVGIVGVHDQGGNVVTGENSRLVFKPSKNFFGVAQAEVRTIDCPFFVEKREIYEKERTTGLEVKVHYKDAPTLLSDEESTTVYLDRYVSHSAEETLEFTTDDVKGDAAYYGIFSPTVSGTEVVFTPNHAGIEKAFLVGDEDIATLDFDYTIHVKIDGGVAEPKTVKMAIDMTALRNKYRVCKSEDYGYRVSACSGAGYYTQEWDWVPSLYDKGKLTCVVRGDKLPNTQKLYCDYVGWGSSTGWITIILSSIGVVISFVFVVGITKWFARPIMRLSQPIFLVVSVIGALLCCAQNFLTLGANTDLSCTLRVWAINMFFDLLFGPLMCKTYRVNKIMNNKKLRKVAMTNFQVFRMLIGFLLVEFGILIAWQLIDPVKLVVSSEAGVFLESAVKCERAFEKCMRVSDPVPTEVGCLLATSSIESPNCVIENNMGFGFNMYDKLGEQTCADEKNLFGNVVLFYKAIFVLYGCYLGWQTRRFDSSLAESKYIMVAMYQIAVLGIMTLLLFSMGVSVQARATLQVITTVIGSLGAIILVIGPKFLRVNETQAQISSSNMTALQTSNQPAGSGGAAGGTAGKPRAGSFTGNSGSSASRNSTSNDGSDDNDVDSVREVPKKGNKIFASPSSPPSSDAVLVSQSMVQILSDKVFVLESEVEYYQTRSNKLALQLQELENKTEAAKTLGAGGI